MLKKCKSLVIMNRGKEIFFLLRAFFLCMYFANCLSASLMLSVNSLFLLALHELLKIAESDGRTACLYELRAYD